MKLNLEFCRWILSQTEKCPAGCLLVLTNDFLNQLNYHKPQYILDVDEQNFDEVYEHILVLSDANLIKIVEFKTTMDGTKKIGIDRLTMAGHDFLNLSCNEEIWNKVKGWIEERNGGHGSIKLVIELLEVEVKKLFGLR